MNDIRDEQREFTRGLEGVVAAESSISYVDGVHGRLLYQGYDIHDLAEHTSLRRKRSSCSGAAGCPRASGISVPVRAGRRDASAQPGDGDAQADPAQQPPDGGIAHRGQHAGELRPGRGAQLAARPTGARRSGWSPRCRPSSPICTASAPGMPLLSPDPNFDVSANFLYMMRGTPPNKLERRAMEVLMVLHADHELNASTFTARVHRQHAGRYALGALAGALGALKGPLHGGANQRVMEMILDIPDVGTVQAYIAGMLENKKRIMGFGHRVYRTEDPRTAASAQVLRAAVRARNSEASLRDLAAHRADRDGSQGHLSERRLLLGHGAARPGHSAGVLHDGLRRLPHGRLDRPHPGAVRRTTG